MREAQQNKSKRVYRFCLLRIRVNSDYVLQGMLVSTKSVRCRANMWLSAGIFESNDSLHAVYRFVCDSLAPDSSTTFVLQTQHDRSRLEDSHDVSLKKANLVPSATLVPVGPPLQLNAVMIKAATQFA
jgi:hypothetical protein